MSKNSPLQTYQATVEWLEAAKRQRKLNKKKTKNATTTTKHRSKPNNRRDV